jgi:hypothetical protein
MSNSNRYTRKRTGSSFRKVVDHKIRKLYFLEGARDPLELQWKQHGGGKNEAQGMVEVDGNRYIYTYTVTKDETKYAVYRKKGRHCFIMYLFDDEERKGKKMAVLESLDQFTDCSLDNGATGKQLLLAAIQILRNRKDVSYVDLNDKSGKNLPNGKKIPLADMYFVCTGKTWYGSIIPLVPSGNTKQEDINIDITTVNTNTWADVSTCFKKYYPDFYVPVDISDIDVTSPGSAMQVYRRIKESNSDFFADFSVRIPQCNNYSSMKGSSWRYYF